MRSFDKPTSNQVEAAIPLLSSPQHEAYFFEKLENPHWIAPLHERGMFDHPPKSENVKGGGIRFPIWPASRYLARMAAQVPEDVASILSGLDTDNVSVVGDMIDAARAMPPTVAARLVPAISRSAEQGTFWIHVKDASDLCVHLADGGEAPVAMALADALYSPRFAEGQEQPSRRDEYWYSKGLKNVVPALVASHPRGFLPKLCDWLKASVDAKRNVDAQSGSDYSYLWRPAIEEHEQNRDYDFAGVMVGFVRQGFEQAIRDGSLLLDDVLTIINRYAYLVFKRIGVHLVNEFAEQNPGLARQTMMDRNLFDDHEYKHEYAMLVGRRLPLLAPQERDMWFGWVDTGPDMSDLERFTRERLGRDASAEDRENRKAYWQFEKLHCVRAHLEGDRKTFYERMLAKHGEPELADLNTRISSGWRGHESPVTVEVLGGLTFERAVERASSWEPQAGFFGPDLEGCASTFGQYVGTNPEVFSRQARVLIGRPALYVRTFLSQMIDAIKSGRDIDASAVLDLCAWVLSRPVDEQTTRPTTGGALVDKSWQWTRDEIGRFAEAIFAAKEENRPKYGLEGLREPLWKAVSALSHDRVESYIVEDTSEHDPRLRDYLDLGINSPRGKAVEAALEYARWVANHIKRSNGDREVIPGGFNAMPEVRENLETQIAAGNRRFETMAIIGSRINLVYWIDRDWLTANAERLFHLEGIEESSPSPHGWAAWNAFLVWVRPHIEFYKLFQRQFAYAVAQSAEVHPGPQSREQPMDHLGEHLVLLYGRGQLGFDDDDGLFRRFLEEANPDTRRRAIGFVGQSITGDEKIPEEVVTRFQTLWQAYWDGPGKEDTLQKPNALLFGMWFSSAQFPPQWAIDRLHEFVEVTTSPEPDHEVVEKLAEVVENDPLKSVRIVDRMARGDQEGWRIHGWRDAAGRILDAALRAGGEARMEAERVIDYLGRRGHVGFGELLNPKA